MRDRDRDRAADGLIAVVSFAVAVSNLFIQPVTPAHRLAGLLFAVGAGVWLSLATRP